MTSSRNFWRGRYDWVVVAPDGEELWGAASRSTAQRKADRIGGKLKRIHVPYGEISPMHTLRSVDEWEGKNFRYIVIPGKVPLETNS